ncbi:MAG: GlpM family protein [archaeon]
MFFEILLKFIVGGSLIALISFLSKTKYDTFSGLMVLFPIVTVIGFYFISQSMKTPQLRNTVLFSILSLPTVLSFLGIFYFTINKYSIIFSLILSIIGWIITASFLIFIYSYFELGII